MLRDSFCIFSLIIYANASESVDEFKSEAVSSEPGSVTNLGSSTFFSSSMWLTTSSSGNWSD